MPFGAALTFDSQTENALRALWQSHAQAGLPPFMPPSDVPPHMTLMMAEDLPVDRLRDSLAHLAASFNPIPVEFLSLGVFPAVYGVVFLAPVVTTPLLDLHAAFWRAAAPLAVNPGGQYRPGVWVPHVTLAYDLPFNQLGPAAAFLASQEWPSSAAATRILYGQFNVHGSSRLESIALGQQKE